MRSAVRLLAAVVVIGGLLPAPAHAHASLVESNPEDGQVLETAPDEVSLTLNEPVAEPAFVVISGTGGEVETAPAVIDGRTVTARVGGELEGGEYTLSYRLISADAHAVTGTLEFSIEQSPPPTTAPSPTPTPTDEAAPTVAADDSGADRDTLLLVLGLFALFLAGLVYYVRARLRQSAGDREV